MESKTVVVTGSTGGIGFYSAQEIARLGARVIIAGIWRTTWNGGHWQLTMTTALCLTALKSAVPASGDTFAHLIDDEYKHLNTLREHGGFHKTLLEGRTLQHFHVYIKEDDASQWSVLPHVDNGAFLLLTKTLDVPGMERSRFVLEELCCMESVEQACLAQETEPETAGAQQSEELCRVTDDHDRVEWLTPSRLQNRIHSLPKEVTFTPEQTVLVVCRVAKWIFLTVESSDTRMCPPTGSML